MAQIKSKIYELPKLIDCYGNKHEYKLNPEFYDLENRLHNKKLNISKNLREQKLQRNKNRENFSRTKIQLKIERKANNQANYLETKSQVKNLETKISELKKFIKFSDFIKVAIKNKKNELRKNWKITKKTIESLRQSYDSIQVINSKIKSFSNNSFIKEQTLLLEIHFLEKLKNFKLFEENLKFWKAKDKNFLLSYINKVSINKKINDIKKEFFEMKIPFEDNFLNQISKLKKNLTISFFHQVHFKMSELEIREEISKTKEQIKIVLLESHKKKLDLEYEYEKVIRSKNNDINKTYYESYLNLKTGLEKYESELLLVGKEINLAHKKKKNELLKIEKKISDSKANFKEKYKKIIENKLAKIKYSSANKISYLDVLQDYKLYPLLNWQERITKIRAKADYYINLGQEIKFYTYEGDYKIGVGEALLKFAESYEKIVLNFFQRKKDFKLKSKNLKWTAQDEKNLNFKFAQREKEHNLEINKLKVLYSKKQISKEAYKKAILKENIYFEEDIKLIKLETTKYALVYEEKDLTNKLLSEYNLAIKVKESDINDVRKKTPIEVKKNSSYFKTFLATILPGSADLLNKNWPKAILMLLTSVFMYAFLLPYAFGEFNIKGRGIIGLILLSWDEGIGNDLSGPIYVDSRYSLIEGVIALLFLILAIVFIFISAISTWKTSRAQEIGIRSNNWSETRKILRNNGFPYAISLPGWILIMFIVVVPIVVSVLLAFTDIGHFHNPAAGDDTNWVGFEQFLRLLNSPEIFEPFWQVFGWNLIWAVSSTGVVIFLGTLLAFTIETNGIRGKVIWRTIYMLPWAIPAFLSILFFKVIFSDADTGFINSILLDLNIIDDAILWGNSLVASRTILVLLQGWLGHSYIVLLISGYMKSISGDVYEAASIDGASNRVQFWKITAPIVLMQIAPLLIGQFTFNFNNFSLIFLFNGGGGSLDPTFVYQVGNSDILLSWIYKITFTTQGNGLTSNQALASAMILLMSLVMIVASAISFSRTKAFKRGEENVQG